MFLLKTLQTLSWTREWDNHNVLWFRLSLPTISDWSWFAIHQFSIYIYIHVVSMQRSRSIIHQGKYIYIYLLQNHHREKWAPGFIFHHKQSSSGITHWAVKIQVKYEEDSICLSPSKWGKLNFWLDVHTLESHWCSWLPALWPSKPTALKDIFIYWGIILKSPDQFKF